MNPQRDLRKKLGFTQASNFFLTFWAPILGPGVSMLYLQLRKRCLDNNPFKASSRTLMGEIGISCFHTFSKYQNILAKNSLIVFNIVSSNHSKFSRQTSYYVEENPPFLERSHYKNLPKRLQKAYDDFIERSNKIFLDQLLDFTVTERTLAVHSSSRPAVQNSATHAVPETAHSALPGASLNIIHENLYDTYSAVLCQCPKFKGLNLKTFSELTHQYGLNAVCLAIEVLNFQYREVEIRCPSALLAKTLDQGLDIPDGFVQAKQYESLQTSRRASAQVIRQKEQAAYQQILEEAESLSLTSFQEALLIKKINRKYGAIPESIRYDESHPMMTAIYAAERIAIYKSSGVHDEE